MKLNKTQKYAINHLHAQGKTTPEIAKELEIPEASVAKYSKTLPAKQEAVSEESVKPKKASDFILRETQGGDKSRGVTIMTRQASMLGDSSTKGQQPSPNNIFRPKG